MRGKQSAAQRNMRRQAAAEREALVAMCVGRRMEDWDLAAIAKLDASLIKRRGHPRGAKLFCLFLVDGVVAVATVGEDGISRSELFPLSPIPSNKLSTAQSLESAERVLVQLHHLMLAEERTAA